MDYKYIIKLGLSLIRILYSGLIGQFHNNGIVKILSDYNVIGIIIRTLHMRQSDDNNLI
jgi:hypothetical protein